MKPKPISKEALRKALAGTRITEAPPDHPIYSEGATIILGSRLPNSSRPKIVDAHQGDKANDESE